MKKRWTAFVVVFVMLLGIMENHAYAVGERTVQVLLPSRDICENYAVYAEQEEASQNPIRLYLTENELPLTVTFIGSDGSTRQYTLERYGVHDLRAKDVNRKYAIVLNTDSGPVRYFRIYIVYFTIIIEPAEEPNELPKQEQPKPEQDMESEMDPDVKEEIENELTIDEKLQPLFDKMGLEVSEDLYIGDLKDYIVGDWNGEQRIVETVQPFVISTRCISSRNYIWQTFNQLTGELYKHVEVNIDYTGELDVVTGQDFSLAIDYSQGIIEEWKNLNKERSWNIPLEGEIVQAVTNEQYTPEGERQLTILTVDSEGAQHLIVLYPNGDVQRLI